MDTDITSEACARLLPEFFGSEEPYFVFLDRQADDWDEARHIFYASIEGLRRAQFIMIGEDVLEPDNHINFMGLQVKNRAGESLIMCLLSYPRDLSRDQFDIMVRRAWAHHENGKFNAPLPTDFMKKLAEDIVGGQNCFPFGRRVERSVH